MIKLVPTVNQHYRAIYEIEKQEGPAGDALSYEAFKVAHKTAEDFTLIDESGSVQGCIFFTNYTPGTDVFIHCVVTPKYQKRWCSRAILRQLAEFAYGDLGVNRISSFILAGLTDAGAPLLEALGFQLEGQMREAFKAGDKFHDIKVYGLLKKECKW